MPSAILPILPMPTVILEAAPLAAALLVGVCAPLVGVFVVSRRQAFLADALAHVSLAGIAVATLLQVAPLPVTLLVVAAVALLLEEATLRRGLGQEALLAMALTGALALANVLLASKDIDPEELESLLFGSVDSVTWPDAAVLGVFVAVMTGLLLLFRRQFFLLALDRDIAAASGLKVGLYSRMLAVVVACMVVLIAKTIGVLLCGALLVIPALIARLLAGNFRQALWTAVLAGECAVLAGYGIGRWTGLPAESLMVLAAIVLFAAAFFVGRSR